MNIAEIRERLKDPSYAGTWMELKLYCKTLITQLDAEQLANLILCEDKERAEATLKAVAVYVSKCGIHKAELQAILKENKDESCNRNST
jgi:hypothetical protein